MLKKIFIAIAILFVLIIIGATILVKLYVTPENIKGFIISTAESALNRKVDIGEVNISILKGIEATDFSIKESDGVTDFLKSKEFILKYQLAPLLSKQVLIDEITMRSPEIRVVRDNTGTFNFEDIGKAEKTAAAQSDPSEEKAGGLPISLLVNKISFEDLKFSVTDMKKEIPDMNGTIDLNTSIMSSGGDEIITEGTLNIKLDELKTDKTIKDISASLNYNVAINLEAGDISIIKADAALQDINMSLKGAVKSFKDSPILDLDISIPTVSVNKMHDIISPFVDTEGVKLSGEVSADIKLTGPVKEPGGLAAEGLLKLNSLGITKDQINAVVNGNIRFDKELLNIDMNGKSGRNMASLKGTVKDYSGTPDIKMNIYSKKLFLDELIPAGAEEGTPASKTTSAAIKEEAKPLDLKLTAVGKVKVDSALYKGLEMQNFDMKYAFKDNKLDIERMSASAGKGRLDVVSTIDMSKPGYTYSASSNLDSLHADEVVNAFFPKAEDTVFGILSFNMKMDGSGTLPKNIKKNLRADGSFNIKDGRITDNPLADKLSLFLGVDDLRTIEFNRSEGNVAVRNGTARLNSIFSSDDLEMDPKGDIGLDESLKLAFDIKLSPALTDKASRSSDIAQYIKDDKGWGQIPVLVAGTFSKPKYNVDVGRAGKRVIKKKAQELLEDIFNIDKKDSQTEVPVEGAPEEDTGQPDIQKPLENLLKGIFN